jgi:flagellar motor switch protein FliN
LESVYLVLEEGPTEQDSMSTVRQHSTENPARVEFWKSLLRIEAELAVTLARQELPVERILQFVPGVMIQFEKPCDTPLTIEIDGQAIAQGEVVKIGDKFGLRITEICEREERWVPLVTSNGNTSSSAKE